MIGLGAEVFQTDTLDDGLVRGVSHATPIVNKSVASIQGTDSAFENLTIYHLIS